jgi:hypothetical protein
MSWVFPRERSHFRRYLTFRDASLADVDEWKAAFLLFLKKVTHKYGRTLVLKSPPHTARIRLLLEMFPGAKFVHIHRNPFVVFQSTRKTFEAMFQWQALQKPDGTDLDEWILDQYREMYEAFFEERPLIPSGHYHEMAFEDLERDPLGEMCKLYASLSLPGFSETTGALQSYLSGLGAYRKNEFPDLTSQLKNRISQMWHKSFNEWRYPDDSTRKLRNTSQGGAGAPSHAGEPTT